MNDKNNISYIVLKFLLTLGLLSSIFPYIFVLKQEKMILSVWKIALADTIIFQDGYEAGQDPQGNFINWDETPVYGGVGSASAIDDTVIHYAGNHSARFQLTNGAQGGWAYTNKIIPWPSGKKLWYSCYLRNGPISQSNVTVGGLYFMEAYIVHPSGYRERANIETHPYQGLPDSLFMIRMAYRGRDGQRHRQYDNLQFIRREQWYHITMLVDLSGQNPFYAWWLNNNLVWYEYDTSIGNDTLAPTEFHAGACWIDWGEGNRGLVWIDNCQVADFGPGAGIESERNLSLNNFEFSLHPNPCKRTISLSLNIRKETNLAIILYDLVGREKKMILNNKLFAQGSYNIQLNFCDVPEGIYFLRITTQKQNYFEKIVILSKN